MRIRSLLVPVALCGLAGVAAAARDLPAGRIATQPGRIAAVRTALQTAHDASAGEAVGRALTAGLRGAKFVGGGVRSSNVTVRAGGRQRKTKMLSYTGRAGVGAEAFLENPTMHWDAPAGSGLDHVVPRFELGFGGGGALAMGYVTEHSFGWSGAGTIHAEASGPTLGLGLWVGAHGTVNLPFGAHDERTSPPLRWSTLGLRVADAASAAYAAGDHAKAEKAIGVMRRTLDRVERDRTAFAK